MYGCSPTNMPASYMQTDKALKERVFPMMFDRMSNHFNFHGSSFIVHKSKESTGRVVVWREFQLTNSFTCEASFCGPSQGYFKGYHFNIQMLLDMGRDFCKTLAVYSESDQTYFKQILNELHYDYSIQQQEAFTNKISDEITGGEGKTNRRKGKSKADRQKSEIYVHGMSAEISKVPKAKNKKVI